MRSRADRWLTGFVAAVVEAWQELRIHKLRVLLSLVGVMIAVASLTGAIAATSIAKQAIVENFEHEGRPASFMVFAFSPQEGRTPPPEQMRPAVSAVAERFKVGHTTIRTGTSGRVSAGGASRQSEVMVVDPDFAVMHRVVLSRGRWLEDADARNMSPAVVIDEKQLRKLGIADRPLPFTLDLHVRGALPVTVTVVGTTARGLWGGPMVYLLYDAYEHWYGAAAPMQEAQFEMWVPPKGARQLGFEMRRALRAELPGYQVEVERNDYLAHGGDNGMKEVAIVVSVIAGVILLLGMLSLLNVALVTIQQRVREVGIRRSFGATTGRVFFSVMMESVVATAVAGAVGVMLAIAVLKHPWVAKRYLQGIADVPPFPVEAAVLGLAVSIGVGMLAGVLPALVAARVKIVDAIRF